MSGSPLMSMGVRTMFAASAALQTTGHNIANANVAGYSRQTVELATSKGHFSGAGFMGKGADIVSVNRNYNEHLVRDAATTASQSAFDNARYEQLAALEGVFPMGEAGLSHAASQLFGAMSDLASRPHDIPSRQVVLSRANELASRFNAANSKLDDQQRGVTSDLKVSIGQVNELSRRIAALNQQVAAVRGSGHTPNDLMDQRDQLIQRLSALVPVTTIEASDGSLSVFLGGAQTLVLSNQSEVLSVGVDANDGQRSTIMIGTGTDQRQISSEDSLYSGSIGGLLRFQNVDLVRARDMLNGLATAVATQINDVHTAGLDLDGNAGGPLFAGRAAASINAGNLMLMISDPRQLAAAADEGGQIIDNANALKLAALRDLAFVPGSVLGEASLTSVYRFTDAYGAAMADIGVRVQGARTATEISGGIASAAAERRSSASGVNLDEEAARLIHYQQSYQAAAKMLQIAQSVFDTLLQTAGR